MAARDVRAEGRTYLRDKNRDTDKRVGNYIATEHLDGF